MTDGWWVSAKETIGQFKAQATISGPQDGRLERLAMVLDRLTLLFPSVPDAEPDTESDLPDIDFTALYKLIGAQYPELGYYWCVDPLPPEVESQPPSLGDAIDDLADIYRDLIRVEWLAENGRLDEAAWDFRFGYQTHWGRHLHQLRCHLHWKLYD